MDVTKIKWWGVYPTENENDFVAIFKYKHQAEQFMIKMWPSRGKVCEISITTEIKIKQYEKNRI